MKSLLSFFLLFLFYSCRDNNLKQKPVPFKEFVFSLSGMLESYSVKFTISDTVFIEERFSGPTKRFYAKLDDDTRKKLTTIIDTFRLSKFASQYMQEGLSDGTSLKFYFNDGKLSKTVGIYGDKGPKILYGFAAWLDKFTKTAIKYSTTEKVDFGDLSGVILPPAPPPPSFLKKSNRHR